MNSLYKISGIIVSAIMLSTTSCTDNFEDINTDPVDPQTASIDGIMAGVQYFEFAEPRFVTWRGNLIYTSQFAHHFSYNVTGSWFGADAYQNNQGWTNAVFDASDKSYILVCLNSSTYIIPYFSGILPNYFGIMRDKEYLDPSFFYKHDWTSKYVYRPLIIHLCLDDFLDY